jgi:hypothetical protein
MEGSQHLAELPLGRPRSHVAAALDWLRARATTTPGKLSMVLAGLIAAIVLFGIVATAAERSRAQAAQAARAQTERLLVQAANLYTKLSDANATVATALLSGGSEPPAKRALYLQDLRAASNALSTLTREAGGSARSRAGLGVVSAELPIYSGLVESARANNEQGFPIGAAYLRRASALLTGTVLPAADGIYAAEARRLGDDYGSGTTSTTLVAFIVASAIVLSLLALAQWYVARTSHRILNVLMLAATAVLLVVSIWGVVGLLTEQSSLSSARRNGSDPLEVLTATRILLSRAQGDQSLALVDRGTDEADPRDFGAVMRVLEPSRGTRGLIGEVAALAGQNGTSGPASQLEAGFASYRAETAQIAALENGGQIEPAIQRAPAASTTFDHLNVSLADQVAAAQRRFTRSASSATSAVSALSLAIPLLTVVVAALVFLALRERINEYR